MRDEQNNPSADERGAHSCKNDEAEIAPRLDRSVMTLDRGCVFGRNRAGRDQFGELAAKPTHSAPID
jgi:hypothetical protein